MHTTLFERVVHRDLRISNDLTLWKNPLPGNGPLFPFAWLPFYSNRLLKPYDICSAMNDWNE